MTRHPDWLLGQLPVGMVQEDFFRRFVSIFQDVATTFLDGVDNIEHTVDPDVAPLPLVPWLGTWIGVRWIDGSLDEDVQRRLLAGAGEQLAWRGTARGLQSFLELVTGAHVTVEESGGVYREGDGPRGAGWVRVRVRSTGWMTEPDFLALVRDELPAHVGVEFYLGDRRIWPEMEVADA